MFSSKILRPLVFLIFLIMPTITFFFRPGIYWNMHDDMQPIRQLEMEKCLVDGQIPCRWTPDLGYGYGYPLFNFYPPLPYYVGETFRFFRLSFITSIKYTAVLQFVVAAIGMYLLANILFGPSGGVISALLYTYAPYHAVNVYVRGAMNEAWASAIFPYIFFFAYQAISQNKTIYYLFLSFSYSLLLLSHNPMAMIFSPFLAVWIIYCLYKFHLLNKIKIFVNVTSSLFFSLMLSAYFTLPVLFESKLVQIESMFQNYYHYSIHFVSLFQLFISNYWGDGPSVWGTADGMSFSVGYLHWVISLFILSYIIYYYFKYKQILVFPLVLFTLSYISLFLTHERSTFLWQLITPIQKVQFPWRFLNLSTFFLSLLSGSIFSILKPKLHFKVIILFVLIFLTIFLYLSHFNPITSGPITDTQKFSGQALTNQITGGIYDYLPKTASMAAKSPAKDYVDEISPSSAIYQLSGQKKGTDWIFFNINTDIPTLITLPIIYFPQFKLLVDNQYTTISIDKTLGRIQFSLPSGYHNIYLKLYNTPIRIIGNITSLFSIILFVFLFSKELWNNKKLSN
jgi:hypothetical protein